MRTKADSPTKNCTTPGCTHALRARGLCGSHYNQRYQPNRHRRNPTACVVCGAGITRQTDASRQHVCSITCRTLLQHGTPAEVGTYDWATDAARRARLAGAVVVEVFDRLDVFERDEWTCRICHASVDRDASPFDPDSPTVDHVTPLSRGGEHSLANVQCAHLRCNSSKQDEIKSDAA
ncbi:hypothetical protein GCM10010199_62020 [Dactylosporangium roseum]